MKFKSITIILLLFTSTLVAQQPVTNLLTKLEGRWQAEGKAFGMPATISMTWEKVLANKFIRITYRMDMKAKDGSSQVFEGVALYKPAGEKEYVATWFDSGGEMHPIKATCDETSLTSIWGTTDTKLGKTIYRFIDVNTVEITDLIQNKLGEWKQFNKNILARIER